MEKALLRLFTAVQTENTDPVKDTSFLLRSIKNGFLVDSCVQLSDDLLTTIESVVGISGEKANAAFHKSWKTIQDTPQEELWAQAALHYLTTYGFEALGVYSDSTVYIPNEKLEIPGIEVDMPLTFVRALTKEQVLEEIVSLASTGIALAQDTIDDLMTVIIANEYSQDFVSSVKNRELNALLYDHYGIVPSDPVDFLRYVVVNLCDESLLIKNSYLINKIKESDKRLLDRLMLDAPENLASIFLRFKPIFLAMKSISRNKGFYNKLRKQANKMHVPVRKNYLDLVTEKIKLNDLNFKKLQDSLEKASIFRKIKLAYALKARLNNDSESIVYKIRNGRAWATEFSWHYSLKADTQAAFTTVLDSIATELSSRVGGKTVYIPSNMTYTLPATEKQFTGFFPTGSYITVPEDLVMGIYWEDNEDGRVDLDLSMISRNGKIGWNSGYKSVDGNVLYSGDVTSAPVGASELFYIKQANANAGLLTVNYYNYTKDSPVAAKIIVASENPNYFGCDYMVDPNNLLATPNIVVDKKQTILGLVVNVEGENRFYLSHTSVGNSNVSSNNVHTNQALDFMTSSLVDSISLNEVLRLAGAEVVDERPEDGEFVSLDPSELGKNTIVSLLAG